MIKSFGYYGTVGDQINETRGAVNRLWVCTFDGVTWEKIKADAALTGWVNNRPGGDFRLIDLV